VKHGICESARAELA